MSKARQIRFALLVGVATLAWAHGVGAQQNAYRLVEGHFKLPEGRKIGSTASITMDRDGSSVWAFERCGANNCVGSPHVAPILKFDASGQLVKSFGAGMFIRPHGIHIDPEGNVWVTDGEGPDGKNPARDGKGHQVFKFSADGKLLMTLGKAGVAGNGPDTFNQPSAVLVAPNGDIFVGDGHGGASARVVKFSKDGTFLKTWGKKGTGPGDFATPHALALDSRGRLFVADRENNRLQIFDQEGRLLDEWKQFGRPSGLFIDKQDTLYVADYQSDEKINPGFRMGITIGSAKDGRVTGFILDTDPEPSQEGVAVDSKGNVFGSKTGGRALRMYAKP